jgi:hypothetical protein
VPGVAAPLDPEPEDGVVAPGVGPVLDDPQAASGASATIDKMAQAGARMTLAFPGPS